MFSTSSDILNLVLSVSIVALSFFLCWAIYYFIAGVQKLYRVIRRVEKITGDVEETVSGIKSKVSSGTASFMMFAELARQAMEFIKERKVGYSERKETKRAKNKKD